MTTTELINLLKANEFGGATGRPRSVYFEINDNVIETDGIEVTGSGDGLVTELSLSLPAAEPKIWKWIPCSERLPDLGIPVVLNDGYAYAVGFLLKATEGKYEWGVNGWYYDLEDWSAWMPLPEPYEGEA